MEPAAETPRRSAVPIIIVVLAAAATLVFLAVQAVRIMAGAFFPGPPRPDAPVTTADIRAEPEWAHSHIAVDGREFSVAFTGELVEWVDRRPVEIAEASDQWLTLGASDDELLLIWHDTGVGTVQSRSGSWSRKFGTTPAIRDVIFADSVVVFGFVDNGFAAFDLASDPDRNADVIDLIEATSVVPLDDAYLFIGVSPQEEWALWEWSRDAGFTRHLAIPEEPGIRDPSIGVSEKGVVHLGVNDGVWTIQAPFIEWSLVTQARVERGGRWTGWIDIAPNAAAWIYHEVDSGYLLIGGPDTDWHQVSHRGGIIGERDFRLGDGNSDVSLPYVLGGIAVVESYEGRIWIDLP